MAHELFGAALVGRRRSPLRRVLTTVSIALHAVVLAAIVVIQVFAVGPLPLPHRPLMFEEIRTVAIVPVPIPPAARRSSRAAAEPPTHSLPPVEEPHGVKAETDLQDAASAPGVPGAGADGGLEGVGPIAPPEKAAPPPAPVPPASQPPVRLHSGIVAPKKIVDVTPAYPPLAQTAHVKGVVILEAVIDARGNVSDVHVLRSVPLLDQAAIDAVRQWRYTPALLNDRPVPVIVTVTINFSM